MSQGHRPFSSYARLPRAGYRTTSVTIPAGADAAPGKIVLVPAQPLKLRIVDEHDAPVAGVEVRTNPNPSDQILDWKATSDADGQFVLPSLPYGHYSVNAFAPDHSAKGMHAIDIDHDDVTSDFDLDEEATISGIVVDEHGQPVAGVQVKQGELAATSDAGGQFTIRAVGAHPAQVEVVVVEAIAGTPTGFVHVGDNGVKVSMKSNTETVTGVRIVVRRASP